MSIHETSKPVRQTTGASVLAGRIVALAFVLGALAAPPLRAAGLIATDDSYCARAWLAEDGLPENRIVGVGQSPDGYLWVATQGGVVRFDGVRFETPFPQSPEGLFSGLTRALALDREGRVWLAKEGGVLVCVEGGQIRVVTPEAGLPKNEAQRAMAVDGEGSVWVAYTAGKVIRCGADGKVDTFAAGDGLPRGGSCALTSSSDGRLWFAKSTHVGVFRDGRFKTLKEFNTSAIRMAPARGGGIWTCVGQTIYKLAEGRERVRVGDFNSIAVADAQGAEPTVVFEDRAGGVWVGTAGAGLFRCDTNGAVVRVQTSHPGILSLAQDREGNMWVGTQGGGLNRVQHRVASLIGTAAGLPFEGVQSICQDGNGELWAVGDNGVLAHRQGEKWTVEARRGGAPDMFVTCVTADREGAVWVGARNGWLYKWVNGELADMGVRAKLNGKSLRSLLATKSGDLWIGTDAPEALFRLRGGELKSFATPPGYRFIRTMTEDAAGNIWAGASDGLLLRISGDTLVNETSKPSGASIRCLYGATNGDLWIGYAAAGAGRLRGGKLAHFTMEQGLPNDHVSQILADNRGILWFAGNQGLFHVREREFDDVVEGRASRVWPVVYARSAELPGLQASFDFSPNAFRAADDRLFFSMLTGVAEVRPDRIRQNRLPPVVLIERVVGDGRTFAVYQSGHPAAGQEPASAQPVELWSRGDKSELRLPPGLQQVEFEFTALTFVVPESVQFRYRLEGLDEKWVEAGLTRVARYTHPPAGNYRFQVIACNNDGVWNEMGDALPIIFEPFFWETIWFKVTTSVTGFSLLCGGLVLGLRRRHRREVEQIEHQRALEHERTRIARDLHDDLGAGLTEIGLLGDLAGTAPALPESSRDRMREITGRARSLVASLDEIVWAINPANDTSQSLSDYFSRYAQTLLQRASIRCRLEVVEPLPDGSLNADERHQLFHAFKETLNNILRHAGATEVRISLSAVKEGLMIRVADNGRGFMAPGGEGSRTGLAGMKERLRQLGGRCDIESTKESGTTITFIVPVQQKT